MTHQAWDPSMGGSSPRPVRETGYDAASFSAGEDTGTRVAACIARHAALELTDHARWWNRWRRRLMARALVACAEELEREADERGRPAAAEPKGEPVLRSVLAGDVRARAVGPS